MDVLEEITVANDWKYEALCGSMSLAAMYERLAYDALGVACAALTRARAIRGEDMAVSTSEELTHAMSAMELTARCVSEGPDEGIIREMLDEWVRGNG